MKMLLQIMIVTSLLIHHTLATEGCSTDVTVTCGGSCTTNNKETEFHVTPGSNMTLELEINNLDFTVFTLKFDGDKNIILVAPTNTINDDDVTDPRIKDIRLSSLINSIKISLTITSLSVSDDGKLLEYVYRPATLDMMKCKRTIRVSMPSSSVPTTLDKVLSTIATTKASVVEEDVPSTTRLTSEDRILSTEKRPTTEKRQTTADVMQPTTGKRQPSTTKNQLTTKQRQPTIKQREATPEKTTKTGQTTTTETGQTTTTETRQTTTTETGQTTTTETGQTTTTETGQTTTTETGQTTTTETGQTTTTGTGQTTTTGTGQTTTTGTRQTTTMTTENKMTVTENKLTNTNARVTETKQEQRGEGQSTTDNPTLTADKRPMIPSLTTETQQQAIIPSPKPTTTREETINKNKETMNDKIQTRTNLKILATIQNPVPQNPANNSTFSRTTFAADDIRTDESTSVKTLGLEKPSVDDVKTSPVTQTAEEFSTKPVKSKVSPQSRNGPRQKVQSIVEETPAPTSKPTPKSAAKSATVPNVDSDKSVQDSNDRSSSSENTTYKFFILVSTTLTFVLLL